MSFFLGLAAEEFILYFAAQSAPPTRSSTTVFREQEPIVPGRGERVSAAAK